MKIGAILPYFGGKRRLAPMIVELIGEHRVYWEPFGGSMSVLLAKPPVEMETVNDLHCDLINLAKVIQDKELGYKLYDRLARTLCCEKFFRESKASWLSRPRKKQIEAPDIEWAYDYFVSSWLGLNGVSGTERYNYQFAVRWCRGGGKGARRWTSVIESMPAWHKRLQNVVIIQRDAFEVLENIRDDEGTAIYCDPPYIDKSDKYVHNFTAEDHERLAGLARRFCRAHIMISYFDDPRLRTLYEGFERIELAASRQSLRNSTRGQKKKPRKEQTEVIFTNKPVQKELF